jgi:hypothetical protein
VPLSKVSFSPSKTDAGAKQRPFCAPQARGVAIPASRMTPTRKCEFTRQFSSGFNRGAASARGAALTVRARVQGARTPHAPIRCRFALGRSIHKVDRMLFSISREKSGTEGSEAPARAPWGPHTPSGRTNPKLYLIVLRDVKCRPAVLLSREILKRTQNTQAPDSKRDINEKSAKLGFENEPKRTRV